ncbi:hypothetical protein GPOL_c25740 [Gordonia polyisoprenivorans VH2]|uniref:Uncharacterized protein n=1 Tax=Gordonia polyisoprenivorans (strain DSM 44266 / VH2) TaxID=1112204 RepID=H6N4L9_GORPV|nr:hypothetical protein [Gordonia polyisoprenivorans]AFA73601.1 hypothetical protein GPOL_c25740 [Gordonia polyisoprenivorans VH2]
MSATVLVAVAAVAFTLGVWAAVIVTTMATRHRPPAGCVLASVPADATGSMARVLAAEVRPRPSGPADSEASATRGT